MSPQLNTAFHWLPEVFGGRQSARSIHFILTFLFVGFTFGHVFMVLATGVLNNMRIDGHRLVQGKRLRETRTGIASGLLRRKFKSPPKSPCRSNYHR